MDPWRVSGGIEQQKRIGYRVNCHVGQNNAILKEAAGVDAIFRKSEERIEVLGFIVLLSIFLPKITGR
jgi:hypothetical protein